MFLKTPYLNIKKADLSPAVFVPTIYRQKISFSKTLLKNVLTLKNDIKPQSSEKGYHLSSRIN